MAVLALPFRRAYIVRMAKSIECASAEYVLCFALRHLGDVRELLVLKVKENNFYAFPPYAKKPDGPVDVHMSLHASGERHSVARLFDGHSWRKDAKIQTESTVKLNPPSELKGVLALFHSGIFPGQFLDLPPVGTNIGHSVVLDAENANFRDDFIVIRVYVVEPGAEDRIPIFPCIGARILHLDKRTTPWLAVEVYQEAENVDWGRETSHFSGGPSRKATGRSVA